MWIESHQDLNRHPKLLKASSILKVNRFLLIGHLHALWWWALDHVPPDGNLRNLSDIGIATAAEWPKNPAAFVRALTDCGDEDHAGFIEEHGGQRYLHDWYDYAGKFLEHQTLTQEQRRKGGQKRAEHAPREMGRFTSRLPAIAGETQPAIPPAGDQVELGKTPATVTYTVTLPIDPNGSISTTRIAASKPKETLDQYIEKLASEFPFVKVYAEVERCTLWCEDNKKPPGKLRYRNWIERAEKDRLEKANGISDSNTGQARGKAPGIGKYAAAGYPGP